jgi:hypothetical protein
VGAEEAGGGAGETRTGKIGDAAEKGQARAKRHRLLRSQTKATGGFNINFTLGAALCIFIFSIFT